MQQATVNLLSDMGAQPATLQDSLVPGGPLDTTDPTATITDPAGGATVPGGNVTISGTAADTDGVVAAVEVSTDNGTTWNRAAGAANWTYTFDASGGQVTAQARAVDDAANIGSAASVTFTVEQSVCPCSIFTPSTTGVQENDPQAVELGVKFRSDVARLDHGDPLLQDRREHGDPHRHAVGHGRGGPRQRHVLRRVCDRLAGGHLRRAHPGRRRHHLCRLLPHEHRQLRHQARRSRRPASTTPRSMPSRTGPTDPTASTHMGPAAPIRPIRSRHRTTSSMSSSSTRRDPIRPRPRSRGALLPRAHPASPSGPTSRRRSASRWRPDRSRPRASNCAGRPTPSLPRR